MCAPGRPDDEPLRFASPSPHQAGQGTCCGVPRFVELAELEQFCGSQTNQHSTDMLQRCADREKKTEVGPVFGRKFLGYCLRRWSRNTVQLAVAPKALDTFKQRIRVITRRVGGQGKARIAEQMRNTCRAGSPTSVWRKLRRSSKIWMRGYAIGSSTGAPGRQSIVAFGGLVHFTRWRPSLQVARDTGGDTAKLD
jgi:hypothetical protein